MYFTLHHGGKREGSALKTASANDQGFSRLYFIRERTTGFQFLVDTGASISVLPPTPEQRLHRREGRDLKAANDTKIATYGECSKTLDLGLRRNFQWVFTLADVSHPILGADFLHYYKLLVDMHHRQLVDSLTHLRVSGIASKLESLELSTFTFSCPEDFVEVLAEFPEVTKPSYEEVPTLHTTTHHIVTNGPPVCARPRRLAPDRLAIAKKNLSTCYSWE